MAVTKLWSVTERLGQVIDYATNPEKTSANIKREFSPEQYQALADVIAYAKDEEKTEREFYVEGINCNVAIAREQFITVKEQYQKTDGIQAYHGYLSFKETDISPEMAQKIGMEFANEVWGKRFQVVVTTHLNTKHLHCHFVINSISFVDGKHLWGEEKAWFKFRKVADRICEKYGLYYDPNPNRSKQSDYLTMKEKAVSTRLTPDTAASPTEDTIKVSARPMVTLNACSAISGSSSATSACRGNRGVDVNLDDFMLSSVANDKKARMLLSYSGCCRNARGCIQESAKKQQPAAFRALYPWAQLC